MFNFLQTSMLLHLIQRQGKVLTEVFMRKAQSENTLLKEMCVLVASYRQTNMEKRDKVNMNIKKSFQLAEHLTLIAQ